MSQDALDQDVLRSILLTYNVINKTRTNKLSQRAQGYTNVPRKGYVMEETPPTVAIDALLQEYGDMLTVDDLMKIMSVSRTAINGRLVDKEDPIPHYRIGKYIRVQKVDFRDWMLRQRRG